MSCLIVFITPFGIELAELPVLIEFLFFITAFSDVAVPQIHKRHILTVVYLLMDISKIRKFIAQISAAGASGPAIYDLGYAIVGDPFRQWIIQILTFLEGSQEVVDS